MSVCGGCHAKHRAPGEPVHEPYDAWVGPTMAMAARDPLFRAAVDTANRDDAKLPGDVGTGDCCPYCHLPQGWLEGHARCDTPWGEECDGACFSGDKSMPDSDWEGITCRGCHRRYDASAPDPGDFANPDAPDLRDGRVHLSTDRGLMGYPFDDPQTSGYHASAGGDLHRSSEFCGQCHDVTHPILNRKILDGTDLGYRMPIDTTWTEWLNSDFTAFTSRPGSSFSVATGRSSQTGARRGGTRWATKARSPPASAPATGPGNSAAPVPDPTGAVIHAERP